MSAIRIACDTLIRSVYGREVKTVMRHSMYVQQIIPWYGKCNEIGCPIARKMALNAKCVLFDSMCNS